MKPDRIGKFRIEGPIGEGGMGIVYAAHDDELDRAVAIKVLHPVLVSSKEGKERFRAEARAVGRLRHPGIVQVYQWSEEEEALQFLVMERLEGKSLDQLMAEAEFSPPETVLRPLHPAFPHTGLRLCPPRCPRTFAILEYLLHHQCQSPRRQQFPYHCASTTPAVSQFHRHGIYELGSQVVLASCVVPFNLISL